MRNKFKVLLFICISNFTFSQEKQDSCIENIRFKKYFFENISIVQFNPGNGWSDFYKQSKGGGKFDYSYSVIPSKFKEASSDPLNAPSPMLFIPNGTYTAHNHMNFGNFLWGATGYTMGFSYLELSWGAHFNSVINSRSNGYLPQFDSKDDQNSIRKGIYFGSKNSFRWKRKQNEE